VDSLLRRLLLQLILLLLFFAGQNALSKVPDLSRLYYFLLFSRIIAYAYLLRIRGAVGSCCWEVKTEFHAKKKKSPKKNLKRESSI
jgi:hypothetical protein